MSFDWARVLGGVAVILLTAWLFGECAGRLVPVYWGW